MLVNMREWLDDCMIEIVVDDWLISCTLVVCIACFRIKMIHMHDLFVWKICYEIFKWLLYMHREKYCKYMWNCDKLNNTILVVNWKLDKWSYLLKVFDNLRAWWLCQRNVKVLNSSLCIRLYDVLHVHWVSYYCGWRRSPVEYRWHNKFACIL